MLAITERCAEEPSYLVAAVAATTTTTTSKATAVAKSFLYLDVTSLAEHVVTLHFVQLPALAALAWVCIAGEGKLLSPKQLLAVGAFCTTELPALLKVVFFVDINKSLQGLGVVQSALRNPKDGQFVRCVGRYLWT